MPSRTNDTTVTLSSHTGTFARLVQASQEVCDTRARLKRRELLASLLNELNDTEFHIAVNYLTGVLPRGNLGLSYTTLKTVLPVPATGETRFDLAQIDAELRRIAKLTGGDAEVRRDASLRELLRAVDADEQRFLLRLLCGQLRRGPVQSLSLIHI